MINGIIMKLKNVKETPMINLVRVTNFPAVYTAYPARDLSLCCN